MRDRFRHAGSALLCLGLIAAFVAVVRASTFDPTAACVSHSRELAAALQQYVQDYDERLPAMATPAQFKAALLPYSASSLLFTCPATGRAYVPNAAISGKQITQFNTNTTVAFQDALAHNGAITVTYLDGTVERGGVVQGDPTLLGMQRVSDLFLATLQYAQDHDLILPPTDTQADYQAAIGPYLRDNRDFYSPATGQPYAPNPSISGKSMTLFSQPGRVVVVESSVPEPDGLLTIGYLDGHVVHGNREIPVPTTQQHERALMLAVLQYTQDYDEHLPPTNSYSAFEAAVSPYVSDPSIFLDPTTGQPFVLNTAISGEEAGLIGNPAGTVFLTAPGPDPDGVLYTGYVNGHVAGKAYHIVRTMAVGSDNDTRLVWYWAFNPSNAHNYGGESLWDIAPSGKILSEASLGSELSTVSDFVEPNGTVRILSTDPLVGTPIPGAAALTTIFAGGFMTNMTYGPFDGWSAIAVGAGANDQPVALWDYYDGTAAIWFMSNTGSYVNSIDFSPPNGGDAVDLTVSSTNLIRILWANGDGSATIQTLASTGASQGSYSLGPVSGDSPVSIVVDTHQNVWILWAGADGSAQVWSVDSTGSVLTRASLPAQAGWRAAKLGVGKDGNVRILWKNVDQTVRLDTIQPNGALVSSQTYAPTP